MREIKKILFVCTGNINRSKTAELLFKDKYETVSAGLYCDNAFEAALIDTAQNGNQGQLTREVLFNSIYNNNGSRKTRKITRELLEWADVIMVFEPMHYQALLRDFQEIDKVIVNLEIPDMFTFMSIGLCERIKKKVRVALKKLSQCNSKLIQYSDLVSIK